MNQGKTMNKQEQIEQLQSEWADSPRWTGVERNYSAEDVVRLRGTVNVEHTLARLGAEKLWRLVNQEKPLVRTGRVDRQPGDSGSPGRTQGDLLFGLAGCRRRQQFR